MAAAQPKQQQPQGSTVSTATSKRKAVFVKVKDLQPGTNGHTLTVKVLSSKTVLQKGRAASANLRQTKIAECLVGDETGTIVFTARNEQGFGLIGLMKLVLCNFGQRELKLNSF